jgi:mRNA interferase RelE/StbE
MRYRLHISSPAAASFNKLDEQVRTRLHDDIAALADDPYPPNSKALRANLKGLRSLRTGDYRTAYVPDERGRIVYIRAVAHRDRFHEVLLRLSQELPEAPDLD